MFHDVKRGMMKAKNTLVSDGATRIETQLCTCRGMKTWLSSSLTRGRLTLRDWTRWNGGLCGVKSLPGSIFCHRYTVETGNPDEKTSCYTASVATAAGLAGRGSLSPTSSVADLTANRDAAVDKFSVSISSFLLDVKMGSRERPL